MMKAARATATTSMTAAIPNNCPDKSAYYKLTGTVAYDPIKENGSIKLYQVREATIGPLASAQRMSH